MNYLTIFAFLCLAVFASAKPLGNGGWGGRGGWDGGRGAWGGHGAWGDHSDSIIGHGLAIVGPSADGVDWDGHGVAVLGPSASGSGWDGRGTWNGALSIGHGLAVPGVPGHEHGITGRGNGFAAHELAIANGRGIRVAGPGTVPAAIVGPSGKVFADGLYGVDQEAHGHW